MDKYKKLAELLTQAKEVMDEIDDCLCVHIDSDMKDPIRVALRTGKDIKPLLYEGRDGCTYVNGEPKYYHERYADIGKAHFIAG